MEIEDGRSEACVEFEGDRLQTDRASRWSALSLFRRVRRNTHSKVVILAHLFLEFVLGPLRNLGLPLVVEPAVALDSPDNPPRLALALEDVSESGVVGESPHGKVEAEKDAGGRTAERDKEDELQSEEEQGQEVDVLREGLISILRLFDGGSSASGDANGAAGSRCRRDQEWGVVEEVLTDFGVRGSNKLVSILCVCGILNTA